MFRNVTQGRCFYGQLNYHIGSRAASEGRPSLYPRIDFCSFPEAVSSFNDARLDCSACGANSAKRN